ncbi:hypothetical protein ACFL3C_03365 [Patescibacteria group bacterium]
MKKTLLNISVISLALALLWTGLFAGTINVTHAADSDKRAIDEVIEEAKAKKNKFLAHDMYLNIYVEVNDKPEKKATKAAASKLGMSEDQVSSVAKQGDLSSLYESSKTLDKTHQQYIKVLDSYNKALATESLRTELEQAVKPSEIFADGDTSNSDFDLIHDLSIIEEILFNEKSKSDFGGTFNSPSVDTTDSGEQEELADLFDDPSLLPDEEGDDEAPKEDDEGLEPLECFEGDDALTNSLQDFEDEQATQAEAGAGEGEEDPFGDETTEEEEFPKAPEDEWSLDDLCPDGAPFCIDIEFIMKKASIGPFKGSKSDCVECTVQKINKAFDDTLAKPLSANKVTGNVLEVAKCKKSLTVLPANMKITTVAVAVPQSTNLFAPSSIGEEWKKFNERTNPLWYQKTDKAAAEDLKKEDPSQEDRAARKGITTAGPGATLDDVQQRTQNIVKSQKDQADKDADLAKQQETAEKQNRHYSNLLREITTMNLHFQSMKETFEKMKTPCSELANKSKCK